MQKKNNRPDDNLNHTLESDKKKLLLPDQLDLIMEDGTIYHVRSFFADKGQRARCWTHSLLKRLVVRSESRHIAQ